MLRQSRGALINYMRHHNRKTAKQYSAEYGKTWTKEITPRTEQDVQLYGWFHNYPYHNQNDLSWWANRRRPRHTIANYALRSAACSEFAALLREHETTVIHRLSIGGRTTLLLPSNEAFTKVDASVLDKLSADPNACRRFLLNHVVQGELNVREIAYRCRESKSGLIGLKTMSGNAISIRVLGSLEDGSRKILLSASSEEAVPAQVVNHGLKCSNGVVFILDGLLV
jgi:uncharacterized surface protein with fasciclin (FAS1) repeats